MLLIFMIVLYGLVYIEYRIYKTFITPFCVIGGVYLAFVPINNLIGIRFGNHLISNRTIILFLIYLTILFFSGFLFRTIQRIFHRKEQERIKDLNEIYSEKILGKENLIFIIFIFGVLSYAVSLFQVISVYGINDTKAHSFGIFAHIGFLAKAMIPFIFFFYTKTKKKKYLVSIIIFFCILIIFQGKYNILITLLSFIMFSLMLKIKINYLKIIYLIIGLFFLAIFAFILIYAVIPNMIIGNYNFSAMESSIQFSIRHFFHYLFSPFITANTFFFNPTIGGMQQGIKAILNPFDTLYQQLSGNKDFFAPIIALWPEVAVDGATANIGGIFSEAVLNIGYLLAGIYIYLLGIFIYFSYFIFYNYRKNVASTAYLLSLISFSFFSNFFSLFSIFEVYIYILMIEFFVLDRDLIQFKFKFKKYRSH
ncbi:DUF6337 family protein [Paenibacillus sp. S150]|uniref:DUF6337 family protein n=1 Tax=Paenibacillus sp. S150 TaxID=2749826 RepID=UPI001C579357|nr:DUF6337 family protein [Paenibacillus sp. S150]MBW4084530.1 oligosaccharide repeat unit polymerase [Paenibacillus sp. S150]